MLNMELNLSKANKKNTRLTLIPLLLTLNKYNIQYIIIFHVNLPFLYTQETGYFCFPAPGPGPGRQPQFVFDGPGPRFAFHGPGPQFVFACSSFYS